jgi:hypothetical protein
MRGSTADMLATLPASVPASAMEEMTKFVAQLEDGVSCLATGSLIEGLGNAHSDVDFYVLQPDDRLARPTAIGLRGSRYVDCEYLPLRGVERLVGRFEDADGEPLLAFSQRDFDRYYRLAIGVPLVQTDEAAGILRRCSKQAACARYADWASLHAYQHFARAVVAHALEQDRWAKALLREAALWCAVRTLAHAGEGYPSFKWTEVKAARRYGVGSRGYHDCMDDYLASVNHLPTALARMRSRSAPPRHVLAELAATGWALGNGVTVVSTDGAHYLVQGRKSLVRVSELVGRLVVRLHQGVTWPDAVAQVSAGLSMPAQELVAASHAPLRDLRKAGYLKFEDDREG